MWPRGRIPPPQGRGTNIPGNYPLTLGFNQYPQPQQGQSGVFRGPMHYNNNNKPNNRRDRLRPRQQGYSFYSDESLNSNYSNKSASLNLSSLRGGYLPGGSGIVNAAMRNLPPRQTPNDNRSNNNDRDKDRVPSRAESNRSERNRSSSQNKENRSQNRAMRESETESPHRMYFCPKCGENYAYRQTQNRYIGKIPLILHCNHTMCQECTYQNLKNNKVNCPTCQIDSELSREDTPVCQTDMQNVFSPNFYIIGIISYYRPFGGYVGNLDNMRFISTASKRSATCIDISDTCCFATCSKRATMYCPSCEGIYCVDCCTVVHKSTKKLMTHEPVPRRTDKFSLMLENCGEHSQMQVEFFCKTCDLAACCYCVLDKHTGHERVPLYHLTETEMEEFKRLKIVAEKALREVLRTQRKAARLANFNTGSVKKDVCQYFADCHAKIETLEKKMCDELENFKSNNRGLDSVQSSLTSSAEQLKQLVAFNEDKVGDIKLNMRGALEKLRSIDDIPRFLLNENGGSEPVRFVVKTASIEALDDTFIIEKCQDSEYRLVTEKDLPETYVLDHDESDSEVNENMSAIMAQSNQSEELLNSLSRINELPKMVSVSAANSVSSRVQKHTKPTEPKRKTLGKDMQRIDVQHINSMDSFFIQHKSNHSKLIQLNKDIEDYVKMGGAQPVEQPQLNNLYLSHYVTESQNQKEQRWCRARLTGIKESETGTLYEMFFIDYGKTQMLDGSRIKDMPPFLSYKKAFAIECMLHNPMSVNWNKKAHVSLAKILNGKDVYMIVKSLNGGVHEVDLMIASSDGGITSVTDILVHAHQSVDPRGDDNVSLDGSFSLRKEGFFPTLKVFPNSKKFEKNQKEKVTIANVIDPHNIFIHLVQYQEAFKSMSRAIKKAYKSAKGSGCIPIEGTYVLVEYKDTVRSNWHRAFVKSVDLDSDRVHVLLVDWGISVVVPISSVKTLQESFTRLESQAVLVKLAHIAPYNAQATWSHNASGLLQGYHQSQDVMKMVVQDAETEVQVALFDVTTNVDMCLNAMMVENNLADSTGPISTKLEWTQYEMKSEAFTEEEGLMASMLKRVDEEANESEEDDCSNVKKRQVDVIKVEGPDLIWVKFLEFIDRESAMFKELQIHYSQEQVTKNRWNVGEQCVVEIKHEYGRAKILEEIDGDYKVYLYDKVKEILVPLERIYKYDKYFTIYPQAVYKSHLANIRPAGDSTKWSKSSLEALQEIFAKHKRIFGNKAPENTEMDKKSLPLDMWYAHTIPGGPLDPDRLKYVSINNFLVKLGFAYKVPRPITSKPSTSTDSPVKTVSTGEDLLKVLTGDILKSSKGKLPEENPDLTKYMTGAQSKEVKSGIEEKVKSPRKDKNKKRSPRKDKEKTQCMKILESLNKPLIVRGKSKSPRTTIEPLKLTLEGSHSKDDEENKKTEEVPSDDQQTEDKENTKKGSDSEDVPKNWIAIVDEELGEPSELGTLQDVGRRAEELVSGAEAEDEESSPYHKREEVIDDWLPAFRLSKRDFQARVTCVETAGHLFIHEEPMDDVYYKMEANIKAYFDSNEPEIDNNHKWEPGQLCTIKYSDGNWYRGKILKIKGPEEISVFMIDFGSDHDLSPDVLFREVLYTDLGCFATKVKLDKVYTKSGSWLSSDYDQFHELVTDWCRIVVKGPLDVALPLVDVYNDQGVFVNQKLIELCPNLSRCSSFPIAQGADEEDLVVIESEEPFVDEILMDNVNHELDKRLSPSLPSETTSNKKGLKYKQRPLPENLLHGKKVLLEIGGILNYDRVALKTPGDDVSEEMYNLVIKIQDDVDFLPPLKDLKVGTPCLAQYSEDEVWYRARISGIQALDLGFIDVLFVDYGNSEAVSVKNVKQLKPEHLRVPQQIWEAGLNITLNDDADAISVMQVLNSIDRKKRYVKIVKEDPLIVDIYGKDDQLCYKALIDSGAIKEPQQDDAI